MAEREVLIRQELGAPDPPQEQEFVSRVDETVDCLEKRAVDPVIKAATSLAPATKRLPRSAAQTTNDDESVEMPESEGWAITE
jgi:hypothetical protein